MKKNILIVWLIVLITGLSAVNGAVAQILTWEDCVREARQKNPNLLSAIEKLEQAGINLTVSKSNYYPQINGSVSAQTAKAQEAKRNENYSYGLSGRQLLFDGFKSQYSVAASSESLKIAVFSYAVSSSNVRLQLRKDFINLLKAQELLTMTTEIATRRKQSLALVTLGYESGREHSGSLLTAQSDLAEAEFEVDQARRNLELAQRALWSDLGNSKFSPIQAQGELKVPLLPLAPPDFEQIVDSVPLLKELIAQKEISRLNLNIAKADFYPQVYASASASRSNSDWPPDRDQWSAGVSLSVPLFSGGSRVSAVNKSKSALRQAQADERSGRASVILTLAESWANLQDAVGQLGVQQKFLTAAEERAKIAEAQYKIGLMSFDNWIIIEDDIIRVKKALLNTQSNALLAEANWEQAKGVTIDESR